MMDRYALQKELNSIYTETDVPMSRHTSFRTGGSADLGVFPKSVEELTEAVGILRRESVPFTVLGSGSNVLAGDLGIRGAVVFTQGLSDVAVSDGIMTAECGCPMPHAARIALSESLTGMEFMSGIPGSIGGGVMMNAGAYGGEIKDILVSADALDENGNTVTFTKEELGFGYRTSLFASRDLIVLRAVFRLEKGDYEEIDARMKDLARQRKEKQPLDLPSAGSTFKRPEGDYAARLIDAAGLRGLSVGGAQVSTKHTGFVVNTGDATPSDIILLMKEIRKRVLDMSGILLEPEVRLIGEFTHEL